MGRDIKKITIKFYVGANIKQEEQNMIEYQQRVLESPQHEQIAIISDFLQKDTSFLF